MVEPEVVPGSAPSAEVGRTVKGVLQPSPVTQLAWQPDSRLSSPTGTYGTSTHRLSGYKRPTQAENDATNLRSGDALRKGEPMLAALRFPGQLKGAECPRRLFPKRSPFRPGQNPQSQVAAEGHHHQANDRGLQKSPLDRHHLHAAP